MIQHNILLIDKMLWTEQSFKIVLTITPYDCNDKKGQSCLDAHS